MSREDFLRRLDKIRVWKRSNVRAPNKPLLLLLALGRVQRGEERLASYGGEVEKPLGKLLRDFGPPRRNLHPEQPFRHLLGDGLWEIVLGRGRWEVVADEDLAKIKGGSGYISGKRFRDQDAVGGFPAAVHDLLLGDPSLIEEAALRLLAGHFTPSLHNEIRAAVGLARPAELVADEKTASTRDPNFRNVVLRAYGRRCAICDFDVRLDDDLVGLDAAHIRWHAAGGPDEVNNGLALCILHHRTFDRGAVGLEPEGERFRVVVSNQMNGQSPAFQQLVDCHGKPLRRPQSSGQEPAPGFVDWHRREVFRGRPLQ